MNTVIQRKLLFLSEMANNKLASSAFVGMDS